MTAESDKAAWDMFFGHLLAVSGAVGAVALHANLGWMLVCLVVTVFGAVTVGHALAFWKPWGTNVE